MKSGFISSEDLVPSFAASSAAALMSERMPSRGLAFFKSGVGKRPPRVTASSCKDHWESVILPLQSRNGAQLLHTAFL